MSKATALLLALLALPLLNAQACDTQSCSLGCANADEAISYCGYDDQVYSSHEHCLCLSAGELQDNVQGLLNCLSCNGAVSGANSESTYGKMAVICQAYLDQGEQAAVSINLAPDAAWQSYYAQTVYPEVTSICPENFVGSAALTGGSPSSSMAPAPSSSGALFPLSSGAVPLSSSGPDESSASPSRAVSGSMAAGAGQSTSASGNGVAAITARPSGVPLGLIAFVPVLAFV